MATVTKAQLASYVANSAGIRKNDAEKAVQAVTEGISEALARGDKVTLVGFGTFTVKERAARTGHNPHTREIMEIPASKSVKFKVSSKLKSAV